MRTKKFSKLFKYKPGDIVINLDDNKKYRIVKILSGSPANSPDVLALHCIDNTIHSFTDELLVKRV